MSLEIGDVMSLKEAKEIEQMYLERKFARLREMGYDVQFIQEQDPFLRDYPKERFPETRKPAPFSFWRFFWTALGSSAFFWFLIRSWR